MPFRPEPPLAHDTPERTGVLLVNLGTPDAPTTGAVRRYLREFLWDPRVVEISRLAWWPILNGIVLAVRPAQSAQKYATVWLKEGSPLALYTERQAQLLKGYLGQRFKSRLTVRHAMRYGKPSIADVLAEMKAKNVTRLLVVPMYPQYAASTTASVMDAVGRFFAATRNVPALRFVRSFATHPAYIDALAQQVRRHRGNERRPAKLVMSFHGLPRYTLDCGDPYFCECQATARALATALDLRKDDWMVTFQSRFGRAKWLEPYTMDTLRALGRAGTVRVDVITPGFVADCLETLEEIGIEGREAFTASGGGDFHALPCLNDDPAWIRALAAIVAEELHGWASPEADRPAEERRLAERALRAKALGAAR